MRRFLAWTLGVLAVVAVLGLAGVGWYYSSEILDVERPPEAERETEVLRVDEGWVTLSNTLDSRQQGTWGLDAPEAYGRVGEIDPGSVTADSLRRTYEPLSGTLRPGDLVDLDGYAYPQDPDQAFDFEVSEIDIGGPLGEQPAWFTPVRDPRRWAVMVHGRAARRNECFRMLEILRDDHEFNSLCVSYRNDPDAPQDPEAIYRQGAEEWRDVEPALQYALDQGAEEVLLVGFSMGGQITANLLRHSALADEVDAVIWDSPLLDWGPAIAAGAKDRDVPGWLVPIGMQASEWRAGIDYDDLNQIAHADEFDTPILLLHGRKDSTVPVSVAERFARARPDLVTLRLDPDAEHVRSWNSFPRRYEHTVSRFIAQQF